MTAPPRPPAHVARFTDLIGVDATLDLLLAMGGSELYLPKAPTAESLVVQAVGLEAAHILAAHSSSLPRQCPLGKAWVARVFHSRGLPVAEIARRLHVTESTVRSYVRPARNKRPDPDQLSLF